MEGLNALNYGRSCLLREAKHKTSRTWTNDILSILEQSTANEQV